MANSGCLRAAVLIAGCLSGVPAVAADAVQPAGPSPATTQAPHAAAHKVHHRHAAHRRAAQGPAQTASLHRPSEPALPPAVGDAPMPNEDVQPPRDAPSTDPNLAPSIFALHYPSSGDGYIAGSSPQTIDNEHAARIGGAQLTVPLK